MIDRILQNRRAKVVEGAAYFVQSFVALGGAVLSEAYDWGLWATFLFLLVSVLGLVAAIMCVIRARTLWKLFVEMKNAEHEREMARKYGSDFQ